MKNRMQMDYCHLFILHFAIYHYYYKYRNLMAHQSTSMTSFIFLIYVLITLVHRCCSYSPLSLSSAVAAMLLFALCLIGQNNNTHNHKHFFFPVLRLLLVIVFFFLILAERIRLPRYCGAISCTYSKV